MNHLFVVEPVRFTVVYLMGAFIRFMARTKDTERVMLVDVSNVANSAQALRVLESFVSTMNLPDGGDYAVELNCGGLLLTPKVFSKISKLIRQHGAHLETVYALLPQTQQAALDNGLFVREKPAEAKAFKVMTKLNSQQCVAMSQAQSQPVGQATGTYGTSGALGPSLPFGDTMSLGMDAIDALDREFLTPMRQSEDDPAPMLDSEVVSPFLVEQDEVKKIETFESDSFPQERPTLYLEGTLRSGQVIRYDGNLVIVGDVHGGSEIAASGNIMIWGELRGVAHAGAKGDRYAEIRALKIEAVQLRVGDVIARRPDRIFNHKPDEDKSIPMPEVARISEGEIKIFNDVIGR